MTFIKRHEAYIGKFMTYICHSCEMKWRMEIGIKSEIPSEYQELYCPYCGAKGCINVTGCIGLCCDDNFKRCPRKDEILSIINRRNGLS